MLHSWHIIVARPPVEGLAPGAACGWADMFAQKVDACQGGQKDENLLHVGRHKQQCWLLVRRMHREQKSIVLLGNGFHLHGENSDDAQWLGAMHISRGLAWEWYPD
jgi:hypothetical protein